MTQQIKMRGWHPKWKLMTKYPATQENNFTFTFEAKEGSKAPIGEVNSMKEFIIMRWTGLQDKKGKNDIYEGDIVRRRASDGTIEMIAVEYQAPRFNIGNYVPQYGYTIIGNIYEDPKLVSEE